MRHFVVYLHRLFAENSAFYVTIFTFHLGFAFRNLCCMHIHSGTKYHLQDPISEMDPDIANIAKLLEDLSTRFGNVE